MVPRAVETRWGDERGESFDEFLGFEHEVGRAIAPALLEAVELSKLGRWGDMAALIRDDVGAIAAVGLRREIAGKLRARLAGIADGASLMHNRAPDPAHWGDVVAESGCARPLPQRSCCVPLHSRRCTGLLSLEFEEHSAWTKKCRNASARSSPRLGEGRSSE